MPRIFADKSNRAFGEIILIITAVSSLLFFLVFEIFQKAYLYIDILIHKIQTDCGCAQMTQLFTMHPFIFGAIAASVIFIFAFVSFSIYKLIKLIVQTGKFSRRYLVHVKRKHSAKLKQTLADLNFNKNRIVEVRDLKPVVFCFGLFNPKVCISNGLIKILSRDELEAVLLHENSHMIAKEPIKLFVIKLFYSIFFFLPGIKTYVNKYITFSELAADELATNNFSDRLKLARAIFKISQEEEKYLLRSELALSFFTSTIAERVNKLSDNNYVPKFRIWGKEFLLRLCSAVFIVLFAFIFLSNSTKALVMHNNGGCNLGSEQSQDVGIACNLNDDQQICREDNSSHQHMNGCNMINYAPVDK